MLEREWARLKECKRAWMENGRGGKGRLKGEGGVGGREGVERKWEGGGCERVEEGETRCLLYQSGN